ncbi:MULTISPECIES: hypothetical protein [unclassified Beijerinckia]|uniref:hypothetical protein n=1 Tax=unclassified Beijerinckia TaxID=2638183 RepID=UPI001114C52C|nr:MULTISPECIES: hypothetical protein [unclassified Beijerinckia]MDH7799708.1 membrane protein YqaA with SNARE-associated domain [Beijerinckia sp. GAS462]
MIDVANAAAVIILRIIAFLLALLLQGQSPVAVIVPYAIRRRRLFARRGVWRHGHFCHCAIGDDLIDKIVNF